MITRRALVEALTRRRVAAWSVIERAREVALADDARDTRRTDTRTQWTVVLHHDVPQGRGTARVELSAIDADAGMAIDSAIALASVAIGPTWRDAPPAAPAKVAVLDPALAKANLVDTAANALAKLRRPAGSTATGTLELAREHVTVQAHSGFTTHWIESTARAALLVTANQRSLELAREARRLSDLQLDEALAEAAADLEQLARATPATTGDVAIILRAEAFLHGGGLGVWSVFAERATAEIERAGLLRYRVGAPIAPGADQLVEPLTIRSDGALDFATRSAPVGDDGDAVRRFPLVERGVAVGLGISPREATHRRVDPNGGVRNLVVSSGTWPDTVPARRTLDIRRLRSLAIDPLTGDASLELALGIERDATSERAVTGGTIRLDLVAALARARRSATPLRRGAYLGPTALLIDDVALIA